jgi:hypothetical protein
MPSTIPSAAGVADYWTYFNSATAGLPDCETGGFPDAACVAAKTAFINQVNAEWTGDPKSGHNVALGPPGGPPPIIAPAQAVQAATTTASQAPATQAVQAAPAASTATTGTVTTGSSTTGTTTTQAIAASTTTGFLDTITNFLSGSMIGGIPNWVFVGGGAVVLVLVLQPHGRR